MKRLISRACLAAVALLSIVACQEATAPTAVPTEVQIRAYVDATGTGTFSSGDVPIANAQVRLLSTVGNQVLEATTNAEGLATFAQVPAGSYRAELSGNVPSGAELATAASPVIVAGFYGGEVRAEFRYVFRPGSIQGVVYRDDTGSGQFDPGDTPAPGVLVVLRSGSGPEAPVVDSTRTNVAGAFEFSLLRPGAYTLQLTPLPGIQLVGGNVREVMVPAETRLNVPVQFTGSLRINVIEARQRAAQGDSSTVLVEGVATVGSVPFGGTIYVQDATDGVMVFPATGTSVNAGDQIRVSGLLGHFGQELQIGRSTPRATVEVIGTGTLPTPRTVTGVQIAARTFEGELAIARRLTVTAVGGGPASATYNVTAEAEDGTVVTIRVQHANVAIPQPFWSVGTTYDVTGLLGSFNNVAQLKPRSQADVVVSTGGPLPIAQVRQRALQGDSSEVLVQGVATVGTGILGATTTTTLYVQDATGGIMVFAPTGTTVNTGDRIRVTAVLGHFGRELQLGTSANRAAVEELGTGTLPTPRVVTGAQVAARTFEGLLARTENVEVANVPTGTTAAFDVTVRHPDGQQFIVRVMGAGTGLTRANFTVGQRYDVTGLLGSFNDNPQLKPRSPADVVPK
jgi:DNA/RNA endonuclease YhcR with UshA esterase domain